MNGKKERRKTEDIKTATTKKAKAENLKRNVQAFAPLYSVLSLCNFGLSHVGHQTTKKLFVFFSPNFVYSVIINQSRGMTRLLGSDRQKEYVERLTWKKKKKKKGRQEKRKGDGKRDLSKIASFLNFQGSAKTNWVCVSLESVCMGVRACVYMGLCS